MTKRCRFSAISLCLLLFCGFVSAQTKPENALSGRVLLDDGQPATRAKVTINSVGLRTGGNEQSVECDETGSFKLSGLASGSYSISAMAPGYVSVDEERVYRPGETASIRLVKGGVVTGRVTESSGEPLVDAKIKLQRLREMNGKPVRNGEDSAWSDDIQTDDRGIYRAYGLLPGTYIVSSLASNEMRWLGAADNDLPTYYPSTTRDAAMEIIVRPGDEITNIDIRQRGDTGRAISGMVSGTTDSSQPFNSPGITLLNAATREVVSVTSANQAKTFVFFGIPDGDYELYARIRGRREESAAGSPPLKVTVRGTDVTGINLRMIAYGSLGGRVIVEPAKPAPADAPKCESNLPLSIEEILLQPQSELRNPRSLNALLAENDEADNRAAPNEKGEFTLLNLEPDSYRIEADLPGDHWFVRSMTLPASGAGKTKTDIARSPINLKAGEKISGVELTIAPGAASLAGRVMAKEGRSLPSRLRVYLVPAEPTAADDVLRYREALAESDGSFAFKRIAPGKYRLLARSIPDTEKDKPRPAAFDATERLKLRKDAEAANNEVELPPCQRVKDPTLRW